MKEFSAALCSACLLWAGGVVSSCSDSGGEAGPPTYGVQDAGNETNTGGDAGADVQGEDANSEAEVGFPDTGTDVHVEADASLPPDPCAIPRLDGFLRLVTYNIRAGRTADIEDVAAAILDFDPDIVGVQEIDVETERSGWIDQMAVLSARTGMAAFFAKTIDYQGGEYGIGILSRFPILSEEILPLPRADAAEEARVLLTTRIDVDGVVLTIGVTHVGGTAETRALQVDTILTELSAQETFMLMGDFNHQPSAAPHQAILAAGWRDAWQEGGVGSGFTVTPEEPQKRIDFLYLGDDAPTPACIEVPSLFVSDHLPIVATFPWPT